jgi:hypothetical protein
MEPPGKPCFRLEQAPRRLGSHTDAFLLRRSAPDRLRFRPAAPLRDKMTREREESDGSLLFAAEAKFSTRWQQLLEDVPSFPSTGRPMVVAFRVSHAVKHRKASKVWGNRLENLASGLNKRPAEHWPEKRRFHYEDMRRTGI